jgi:deazaflavin-dependent oxidoreductase (nitroreductase family)
MPAPRWLARFNKRVTNRVLGHLVPHLPGFGLVVHRGRKSGREYRTPVNAFRRGDSYTFALTYGPRTEWVQNVLAAGGCSLEMRGRTVRLTSPRLFHDVQRRAMPPPVRVVLGLGHVDDFLTLDRERRTDRASPES